MIEAKRFRARSRASSSVSSSILSTSLASEPRDWNDPILDDPIITVHIPLSDLPDYVLAIHGDSHPALNAAPRPRKTWYGRRLDDTVETISVRMRSSEYNQYFAKDRKTGEFLDDVRPPPEGRSEWVMKRLQYRDWWSEDGTCSGGRARASSAAARKVEEWFGRSA